MEKEENATTATVVEQIVSKYRHPELVTLNGNNNQGVTSEVLIIPDGLQVVSAKKYLDEYRTEPEGMAGTAHMTAVESFINFVNRFKDADSALFFDKDNSKVTAVFDYNIGGEKKQPRFGKHVCTYTFKHSTAMRRWRENDGKYLDQTEFAALIETSVLDLMDAPKPEEMPDDIKTIVLRLGGNFAPVIKMIELSRGIKINSEERAESSINRSTGEVTLSYSQTHGGAKDILKVPNLFMIGIPIYENENAYSLPVQLRYRLREGVVKWSYEIYRFADAVEHAQKETLERLEKETGLPIYCGSPERSY